MKESVLKSFIRDTYNTSSTIPYIITGQAFVFILLHLFELLYDVQAIRFNLFEMAYSAISLPANFNTFLTQSWSFITHPFAYRGIFNILFDCLWLYWIGNIFLTFLNNRQFNMVFFGGLLVGATSYVLINLIPFMAAHSAYWNTTAAGIAALIISVAVLVPNYEVKLFLFGNVRLKIIAAIYLAFQFGYFMLSNKSAAFAYLLCVAFGFFFMVQLQKGIDWSRFFKKKSHLKIIENKTEPIFHPRKTSKNFSQQEVVDQILDKISLNGYESLTSQEKDILFKASKQGE